MILNVVIGVIGRFSYFRVGQHEDRRTRWTYRHSHELCPSGSQVPTSGAEIRYSSAGEAKCYLVFYFIFRGGNFILVWI